MSEGAARAWLRILMVADAIVALGPLWVVVALMHGISWNGVDDHSWADYAIVVAVVLGGSIAIIASLSFAARWLIGRGWRLLGLAIAGLPVEALLGYLVAVVEL